MAETLLLIGHSSPLGQKLSELLLRDGNTIISTVSKETDSALQPGETVDDGLSLIEWNPHSPVSAHNVLIEAIHMHGRIDRALFIFDTTKDNRALHELSLSEIERYIDSRFKGRCFLLKELIHYFQKNRQHKGVISLILHSEGAKVLPPLDGMGTGAFRSLGNSLFTFYQNEELIINGFESSTSESGEYAEFIVKTMKEKGGDTHGKWYRFNDRNVLNAFGFPGKR